MHPFSRGAAMTQSDRDLIEDVAQERESLYQLKTPRLFGWLAGGCITFVSVVGVVASGPNRVIKTFATGWMYGGIAILVSNEGLAVLYSRRAKDYVDQELAEVPRSNAKIQQWHTYHQQQAHQWQTQQQQYGQHIAQLQQQIESLIAQHESDQRCIEEAIAQSSQLESDQAKQSLGHETAISQLTRELEQSGDRLERLQMSQRQRLESVTGHAKHTIYQIIHEWQKRLSALLDNARIQQNPIPEIKELHDGLHQVEVNHKHKIDHYQPAMGTDGNFDLHLVMDQILSLLHYAGRDYSELHAKIQLATNAGSHLGALHNAQSECDRLLSQNRGLSQQLTDIKAQDLVPRALMQQHVEELQAKHQEIITQFQQQLQALSEDSSTDQVAQQAIARLEKLEAINNGLTARVKELSAPILYHPANREDQRMSNAIAQYFQAQGLILDRAYSHYQKWKADLYFHIDRNRQIVLDSELNEHSQKLTQLTNSLSDPKFSFDKSQGLMSVSVQLSNKPPVGATEVNKIWKSVDQFPRIVAGLSPRWRFTGGSEGGKSPTAENVVVCYLMALKKAGKPFRVRVANPQFNSKKNFWSLPQAWKSHDQSLVALNELKTHLDARAEGMESREILDFYVFDEVDSSVTGNGKVVADILLYAIKQVSHQNMGVAIIGQNPNVSTVKTQKADWENAVIFHIGSAALHAIEKDDALTTEQKTNLKKQWDIINSFCNAQNQKFGFVVTGDEQTPEGYRFAWVRGPHKNFFLELPAFGRYTFDQIESVKTMDADLASISDAAQMQESDDPRIPSESMHPEIASKPFVGVGCRKCNVGTFMKVKKNRNSFLYQCSHCKQWTSENVLRGHLDQLLPPDDDDDSGHNHA